jgi:hypothetical protein
MKLWLFALLLLLCASTRAAEPDWEKLTEPDVVRVITVDPDGDVRETKVWIVAQAGNAWLRTSDSRWLANLRRDPNLELRSGDEVYELRAEEVEDSELLTRVDAAMRAKYGWSDRLVSAFRFRKPNLLRLSARDG